MPEAFTEGRGDEFAGRDEDKSEKESKEEKKLKEKEEKKKEKKTEQKEKLHDFKGKKLSLEKAFQIAVFKVFAEQAKKAGAPLELDPRQLNFLRQSLVEAGLDQGEVNRMLPKRLSLNAFRLVDQAEVKLEETGSMTEVQVKAARDALRQARSIPTSELEDLDVILPVAGGADGEEGAEIRDSTIDKDALSAELPSELTVERLLGGYIHELRDLIAKEWKGTGELLLEDANNLANQISESIRKGDLNRDQDVQSVKDVIDTVRRELQLQSRTDAVRLRPREKEAFPLKTKLAGDIRKMMELDEGSDEWTRLQQGLQAEVNRAKDETNNDYRQVYEVVTAVREVNSLCSEEGEQRYEKFKRIVPTEDLRVILSDSEDSILEKRNRKFTADWRNMSDAGQRSLAGDIDEAADLYVQAILSGWRTMENAEDHLRRLMDGKEDPRGFRKWRATEALRGLETTILENQKTRVPSNPADIQERVLNVFRKAEAAGLSTEDLGPILNEGLALVRAMPSTTPEQRKRREVLIHRLESFRGIHVFLINLEKGDMNPEKVVQTFSELWEGREEITLEDFLSRYEEDDRGREFYMGKDEEGNDKKANLFDEEFKLYSQRLRDERIKMNMIEEMTKYAMNSPDMAEIKRNVGFNKLPKEWRDKWEDEFYKLRDELKEKLQARIDEDISRKGKESRFEKAGKTRAEEAWGSLGLIDDTKAVVEDWHKHRTLHGAVGRVGESTESTEEARKADKERQLKELADEFNMAYVSDEDKKKVREKFLGKQYLAIRREKLVDNFMEDLKKRGLQVNKNFSWREGAASLEGANFDDLKDKGYFESLDNTAYRMAWVMMWSNYDNIRIYSKDTKTNLHDIYERTVFHSSTNLFNARAVDHLWEFYHSDAENRGRAKHNETNEIWKQFLPGKHHYVFPQNTMLIRWAGNFMSEAEKEIVEERTKIYMDKYDFHNPGRERREGYEDDYKGWMRNVVIMDMFENGELMLGEHNSMTDLARRKQLKKFEFIDVYADRGKALAYGGTQEFQAYLANPTNAKFVELNRKDKFYSTRSARQFPWMALATRAHWEIGNKHYKRLFDKDNMQSVDFEQVIQELVANGDMEKEAGEDLKKKNLGFVKISPHGDPEKLKNAPNLESNTQAFFLGSTLARRVRQALEIGRKGAWDYRFAPLGVVAAFFAGIIGDIGKRFFKQTTGTDK